MAAPPSLPLTGRQVHFPEDQLIVSKTDPRGVITYANHGFCEVAGYTVHELLGRPHSVVRHPDMPRAAFSLLWETLQRREEFFGFVVNRARNGDHYWVFAHVTPSRDAAGRVLGYHSMRRKPDTVQVERIVPIYRRLLEEEARHASPKDGMAASAAMLTDLLDEKKVPYDEFAFSL